MKPHPLLLIVCGLLVVASAGAYPPAPYHAFFGTVRDPRGNPLPSGGGMMILRSGTNDITRTPIDATLGPGINYTLRVPMDAGTTAQLYQPTALRPTFPFTIRVIINGVTFVPIQIQARAGSMGKSTERTRLDMTLGVDSDGDGLPDEWEQDLIDSDPTGLLRSLADVRPGDDIDGDGLSNLAEFLAGTYALASEDGLRVEFASVTEGVAKLKFLAIRGRTYQLVMSENLTTWSGPQTFSLDLAGAQAATPNQTAYYTSADSRYLEIYVPVGTRPHVSFRLYVQ